MLPSIEHAILETFPLGTDAPPETAAIARLSGYRTDQVWPVLVRLAGEELLESVGNQRWTLTAKGHLLREMVRTGEDLRTEPSYRLS